MEHADEAKRRFKISRDGDDDPLKKLKRAAGFRKLSRKRKRGQRVVGYFAQRRRIVGKSSPVGRTGGPAPDNAREQVGEEKTRSKSKISSTTPSLFRVVQSAVRPYVVSADKAQRTPKVRISTAKTRTVMYVDYPPDSHPKPRMISDEVSIAVYLDTDDEQVITNALDCVDALRVLAGLGEERDIQVRRGSIFRRSWASLKKGARSSDVRDRLVKLERAVELAALDTRQAEYDSTEASAVQHLIESLQDVSRACIRVGSIFLVKTSANGESVILVRILSQIEMRALERFPEIQMRPDAAFTSLAAAVDSLNAVGAVTGTRDAATREAGFDGET